MDKIHYRIFVAKLCPKSNRRSLSALFAYLTTGIHS